MPNKYARFFAILKQINATGGNLTKEEAISDFTGGKTSSLSDLTPQQLSALETTLATMSRPTSLVRQPFKNSQCQQQRRKLIAIFNSIHGKATGLAECKRWVLKQGVNGQKKPLNDYDSHELSILITVAEKIKEHHIKSLANL